MVGLPTRTQHPSVPALPRSKLAAQTASPPHIAGTMIGFRRCLMSVAADARSRVPDRAPRRRSRVVLVNPRRCGTSSELRALSPPGLRGLPYKWSTPGEQSLFDRRPCSPMHSRRRDRTEHRSASLPERIRPKVRALSPSGRFVDAGADLRLWPIVGPRFYAEVVQQKWSCTCRERTMGQPSAVNSVIGRVYRHGRFDRSEGSGHQL